MLKSLILRNYHILFFLIAVHGTIDAQVVDNKNKLKLVAIKQLGFSRNDFQRYDLSGIAHDGKGNLIAINDRSYKICKIVTDIDNQWKLEVKESVNQLVGRSDFEAITVNDGRVYIGSEKPPLLSEFKNGNLIPLPINHQKVELLVERGNSGIEAIAFDSSGKRLYFADEAGITIGGLYRNPVIYSTLLNGSQSVIDTFHKYTETDDISDMVIYKSHLFVLKRFSCKIEKWRLSDKTLVESRSFKSLLFKDGLQRLYGGGSVGLAEALLIKDGKIFVGLDNGNMTLHTNFLNDNRNNILSELLVVDGLLEPSNFNISIEPIVFIFEDLGNFIN